MGHRVCPWWAGYLLASPIRGLMSDKPPDLLAPYVREGMTVLEPGPGMGYFTIELARLVGRSGRVIAVDVQPKMLEGLKSRAAKAGVLDRINARLATGESMGVEDLQGSVDFVLAFAVVHEMPSPDACFGPCSRAMKRGAEFLLAEPRGHVKDADFAAELEIAARSELQVIANPTVRGSHSALLRRN
jgi:ubiquinone/menaquinone biosynthesis C-methylase UbiE